MKFHTYVYYTYQLTSRLHYDLSSMPQSLTYAEFESQRDGKQYIIHFTHEKHIFIRPHFTSYGEQHLCGGSRQSCIIEQELGESVSLVNPFNTMHCFIVSPLGSCPINVGPT